ncbi:protein argonaute 12 [Oryza sativa Japonica Group]|uniref:protein argonaute 12 n=1 Tax=Oryza sativa subsp. japonica TaxID=39947 RepID=UPI00339D29AA
MSSRGGGGGGRRGGRGGGGGREGGGGGGGGGGRGGQGRGDLGVVGERQGGGRGAGERGGRHDAPRGRGGVAVGAGAGRQQQQPFHAPAPPSGGGGRGGVQVQPNAAARRPVGGGRGGVGVPAPAPAVAVGALCGEMKGKMVVSGGAPPAGQGSSLAAAQGTDNVKREPSQVAAPAPAPPPATLPPSSSKAVTFPARPDVGTIGRRCRVRANHFLVQVADKDIYHYDVVITPESTYRERNRSIINKLVALHKQFLDGRLPVYDGRKSIYTAGPLPFKTKDFVVKHINPLRGNQREEEYKVTIKQASKTDLYSLKQFLVGRQRELPQDTIQALDIALRECPTYRYVSISRSFFSQSFGHGGEIGSGTECWRGYYQSLRPTQMGLSLNIDISATAFYKAQPVMDFAVQYLNIRDVSRRLSDQDRIKLKKALKGVQIVATHWKEKSIRYKITGIPSAPMNELMFDLDGNRISVVQYFKKQYNYSLKHVNWPCLQAGSDSRPKYLPMEVCSILEGQRYSKKLNEHQVTNILRMTCERPAQRESSIIEIVNTNSYGNDDCAKEFGIKVANQLAVVDARVLPTPRLKYHDSGREKVCNPSVGQWNMINKRMVNGGCINHWTCLSFASRMHVNDIRMFCEDLVGMCNNIGMQMNTRPCVDIIQGQQRNIEGAIRNIHRQSSEKLDQQDLTGQQLQLLIVILTEISGSYGRIKRICETEVGVITQCCAPKSLQKGGKQYLENLALKMNVKVGGRNTVLEDALHKKIPILTDRPTIVFGADVTHPSPGEDASPSIAAVVASMDWPEVTKYKCLVSTQSHREEIISNLYTEVKDPLKGIIRGGMIRELLRSFYQETGQKPSRIIFYRDGISEGQFSQVLLYEMDAIRKACASLQEGYLPPVTFVVVQKRHHTRLFPENRRDMMDRSGNILPGTVVDTMICHPSEFDFYLCSHSGIKGTSRPTHYHVLLDENGFKADTLQTLTYNLSYTYARCTRAVSIVPPAYYAHLGAFRARYYMEDEHSDQGSSSSVTTRTDRSTKPLPEIKENVKRFMFYC